MIALLPRIVTRRANQFSPKVEPADSEYSVPWRLRICPPHSIPRAGGKRSPTGASTAISARAIATSAKASTASAYIRENVDGELVQNAYGRPAALAIDPIEKKPLFHFHPGSPILSLGTAGCNLGCQFCQNFDISKARSVQQSSSHMSPQEIVDLAIAHGSPVHRLHLQRAHHLGGVRH